MNNPVFRVEGFPESRRLGEEGKEGKEGEEFGELCYLNEEPQNIKVTATLTVAHVGMYP